ncbi:MAG: ABC transporter permease [Clostridiales bacterium]|jgi:sulfonate transport system permease protein|nr:ABC transporter permease [Clostridiales bacterium]
MKSFRRVALGLTPPVAIVLLWWYVTYTGKVPPMILPSLPAVGNAFKNNVLSGQLLADLGISLTRVVKGYLVAASLGVVVGTLIGVSRRFDELLSPTLHAIRSIPMMAWLPLIILWCGIGEESKIVIIVISAFFPVMINTIGGITDTPQQYLEVARLGKMGAFRTFWKVYLPSAVPQIFVGLRLGLSISWIALVASELLAANSGIGFRISDSRIKIRPEGIFMGIIVIGIIGVILDKGLTTIAKRATRWNSGGKE